MPDYLHSSTCYGYKRREIKTKAMLQKHLISVHWRPFCDIYCSSSSLWHKTSVLEVKAKDKKLAKNMGFRFKKDLLLTTK
jgi:hypothetical protein